MEKTKKNILIIFADAGFGHRSAALAIKSAIEEQFPDQFLVSLINPLDNKKAPPFLHDSQSEYDKWVRDVPELYKFGYDISDSSVPVTILETILTVSLFEVFREIMDEYQPDIVINTYPLYQAPFIAVRSLNKKNVPLVTIVTDLATVHQIWFNEKADLLIVPTEIVKEDAIETGVDPNKIRVAGIPVNPKIFQLEKTKKEMRKKLGWNEELPTILAVGSKRVEHFKEYLNILNHSGFSFQLVVVTGKDKELYEELQDYEWHHEVVLYEFIDNMPDLMRASDLMIAKAGGLIVTESLASGLPILVIDVIPGQESGNAKFVQDKNAGFWIKDSVGFLETISHLMISENNELHLLQDNAKEAGIPSAAMDIIKLVINQLESGGFTITTKEGFIKKLEDLLLNNQIPWQ
ncbi:MAG TPA: glycosyltransferase [Anaerolineaceae bacterium]|nr:glycosyltransferase [Anaerolineaceae bacterium]